MREHDDNSSEEPGLERVERALTESLRARTLSAEALQRIQSATEGEWRAQTSASDRGTRWRLWGALAAAVVLATLSAVLYLRLGSERLPFGTVARLDVGGAARVGLFQTEQLQSGDVLKTGTVLQTRGPVLISLEDGGTLRMAADTRLELSGPASGVLQRGQIYVDVPPGTQLRSHFKVATRAGMIEHVGTEFEVLSNDRLVRLRVREGSVRLEGRSRDIAADAGTELTAMNDGTLTRSTVATYGRDWLWVAALAPDYEIEGKPLFGCLQWVSRETGRQVEFSDAHAREVAERTILHGTVRGREPLDALSSVLSTTSLSYQIRGAAIWIQSGNDN